MCGIVGAVQPGFNDLDERVEKMRDALAHRGPDDAGVRAWPDHGVALGHRRLSIIDLSPLGHNPMPDNDETLWITYNGEVYNYAEIRRELEALGHTFRSNSDTEVVLHAYEEWGDTHVERLRGMFAYAIYDRRPQPTGAPFRLLLVRDRVGVKPLFYYRDGERFLFASELKALLRYPGIDTTPDRSAIFDYLTYLYIPAPKSAYRNIRRLPAGHTLAFEGGELQLREYWDIDFDQDSPARSHEEAVELVRAALDEAVRLHMVSDVPVGLFLSGGLDSSAVAAHMTRAGSEPIHSFSIGFDVAAHSETHYAGIVADAFNTNHHERTVRRDAMQNLLPRMLDLYDEPYADGSAMPTLHVAQLAAEQVKVVLSGDGGDEVFAGYRWYDRWLWKQNVRARIPAFAHQTVLPAIGRAWPAHTRGWRYKYTLENLNRDPLAQYAHELELFNPAEKRALLGDGWAAEFADYDDRWYFRRYWREELDPITRIQYVDFKTYLPDDILTKVDRATMAAGLEARPPLLDHVLVQSVFTIPAAIRFHDGERKYLLKRALDGILPGAILTRGKKGFSSPLHRWMRDEAAWVQSYFRQPPAMVDSAMVERLDHRLHAAKLWALMVLEQWARQQ